MGEVRDILNDFFNGPRAPGLRPNLIRVKLTAAQVQKLLAGKELTFKAGHLTIEIRKK